MGDMEHPLGPDEEQYEGPDGGHEAEFEPLPEVELDPGLGRSTKAYVAFAFAAADLLLETAYDGRILFAIGAAMSLVGRPARLLTESKLEEIIRQTE